MLRAVAYFTFKYGKLIIWNPTTNTGWNRMLGYARISILLQV